MKASQSDNDGESLGIQVKGKFRWAGFEKNEKVLYWSKFYKNGVTNKSKFREKFRMKGLDRRVCGCMCDGYV